MEIALAALLGVVQGLTEFLPISSSGHLRLMAALFGIDEPQTLFDICVHAGTLGAVLGVFGRTVWGVAKAIFTPTWTNPQFRLGVFLVIGTLPAGIIGITLGGLLETHLASVTSVGIFLLVNGSLLQLSKNRGEMGRGLEQLTFKDAMTIGVAQSFALFRGISRSGSTITAALLIGIRRDTAAEFSFLLSIPAIGGAVLLKMGDAITTDQVMPLPLVAGTAVAALSGYIALRYLLRLVKNGKLHHFGWYCWVVGAVTVAVGML